MILYPLVYGSFPWSGGYDFHPSNKDPDGKALKLLHGMGKVSKSDLESILRKCSSKAWFTHQLPNNWFLVGHTYNSVDAHNRPSSVVYSFLVSPDVINNTGGVPDPQSLIMDWEPVWTGCELMTACNIMSKGHYGDQAIKYKGLEEAPKTCQKKRSKLPWKPIVPIAILVGLVLCAGIVYYIVSVIKPEPAPLVIPSKPKPDIQTKHIFEWYVRTFDRLPPRYSSLREYLGIKAYAEIPEDRLPVGDFREHLAILTKFLLGSNGTSDGLDDKVENITGLLEKEAKKQFDEMVTSEPDAMEYKRQKDLLAQRRRQVESANTYFKAQAALVVFIEGLSYRNGDFEEALKKEHRKYHVKYVRAATTFDSENIPARLNRLLKEAQKQEKDKGPKMDAFLNKYIDHFEIAQLISLKRKADNILQLYNHKQMK